MLQKRMPDQKWKLISEMAAEGKTPQFFFVGGTSSEGRHKFAYGNVHKVHEKHRSKGNLRWGLEYMYPRTWTFGKAKYTYMLQLYRKTPLSEMSLLQTAGDLAAWT